MAGGAGRRFTPEEDQRLLALRRVHSGERNRYGLGTIAKLLGRGKSAVQMRLIVLKARAAKAAE